jgi:hypothetical protein
MPGSKQNHKFVDDEVEVDREGDSTSDDEGSAAENSQDRAFIGNFMDNVFDTNMIIANLAVLCM